MSNNSLLNAVAPDAYATADTAAGLAIIIGMLQLLIAAGLLAGLFVPRLSQIAAAAMFIFAVGALTLMFTNPVWDAREGGFPAIGAGQGIIKYLSIAGLAMWFYGANMKGGTTGTARKLTNASYIVMLFGIILVLGWIGGMKFTAGEADGVYPLMTTSPFFSWITDAFDKQGASNFIGVIELATVVLLPGWFWNRYAFFAGAALSVITFLGTLSFMVTFAPAWIPGAGFPMLAGGGHFLLKDLVMLAATLVLLAAYLHKKAANT